MFISGHFYVLGMRKTRNVYVWYCDQKARTASAQTSHCGSKQ